MENRNSKVSVIIPCYNGERFICASIESVYLQDYQNIELIVVDDGSLDGSRKQILAWESKFIDKGMGFKYIYQSNQGVSSAINNGLKYVTGDYLTLLDADDCFLPNSILKRAQYLDEHLDYAGVRSNGWYVQENERRLFVTSDDEKIITDMFSALCTGKTNNWAGTYMIRTSILFAFYPEREIYPSRFGQNLQLIMPVAYKKKFGFIDEPLMEYYIRSNSHSHAAENAFEKSEYNANGYLDIYMHMINSIIKDTKEFNEYRYEIKTCFHRSGLQRAECYNNPEALEMHYHELKELGSVTLDDKIIFLTNKSKIWTFIFRCVRKGKTMLKRMRGIFVGKMYAINKLRYPIPHICNRLDTSKLLAENEKLSLVRFGDGELGQVIAKKDIGFQEYDEALSERLREILVSSSDDNILICIPNVFCDLKQLKKDPRDYWRKWTIENRKAMFTSLKERSYGDSLVTRLYVPWVDTSDEVNIVKNLKKAWSNKSVVIVEGTKTRWGVGNDLLDDAKCVKRILCPPKNAFARYENILSACLSQKDTTDVFVLALGPTATILAYDLAKYGVRALDLGHFDLQYEYLIRKQGERIHICSKYNNELPESEVAACDDENYLKSIVLDLSEE